MTASQIDLTPAERLIAATERAGGAERHRIRSHPVLAVLAGGQVPRERIVAFADEQEAIIQSDRRSFLTIAARFPEPPIGPTLAELAAGENAAIERLEPLRIATAPAGHKPRTSDGAQAHPAFVAWVALNAGRAEICCALATNFAAWGENCADVARALRRCYGLTETDVGFFALFAEPDENAVRGLVAGLAAGLAAGESAERAQLLALRLQSFELMFWDAMLTRLRSD